MEEGIGRPVPVFDEWMNERGTRDLRTESGRAARAAAVPSRQSAANGQGAHGESHVAGSCATSLIFVPPRADPGATALGVLFVKAVICESGCSDARRHRGTHVPRSPARRAAGCQRPSRAHSAQYHPAERRSPAGYLGGRRMLKPQPSPAFSRVSASREPTCGDWQRAMPPGIAHCSTVTSIRGAGAAGGKEPFEQEGP